MRLLRKGIVMNVKKIKRLMRKFGLRCPIRRASPYRKMAKAMKTSHVAPNIVKRQFTERGVRKVLLTDITYLKYRKNTCYLSTILDATTREILAYQLSMTLDVDFVLNTVEQLIKQYGCQLDNDIIIHSDQGCHYTSNAFIAILKDKNFQQSMSRKGNCWDNAPQESFFGHMKDEIAGQIATCHTFDQVADTVDQWMDYYNNERYQWDLHKLAPTEYYSFCCTGIHPLCAILPNYQFLKKVEVSV